MKLFTILAVLFTLTVNAEVFRVPLTSSASSTNITNVAGDAYTLSRLNNGSVELQTITLYGCNTNAIVTSSNTLSRISADGAVTNALTTIEVDVNQEFVTVVFNPTIPFAKGDWPRIVGNATDMPFKAQCLFLSR